MRYHTIQTHLVIKTYKFGASCAGNDTHGYERHLIPPKQVSKDKIAEPSRQLLLCEMFTKVRESCDMRNTLTKYPFLPGMGMQLYHMRRVFKNVFLCHSRNCSEYSPIKSSRA